MFVMQKNDTLEMLRKCDDIHFSNQINRLRRILVDKWEFYAMLKNFNTHQSHSLEGADACELRFHICAI
jgi:hypothetical protein